MSHEFKLVRIRATDRSDNDFHMSHEAICCSNLSRRRFAAICRIVCLGLLRKLNLTKQSITWGNILQRENCMKKNWDLLSCMQTLHQTSFFSVGGSRRSLAWSQLFRMAPTWLAWVIILNKSSAQSESFGLEHPNSLISMVELWSMTTQKRLDWLYWERSRQNFLGHLNKPLETVFICSVNPRNGRNFSAINKLYKTWKFFQVDDTGVHVVFLRSSRSLM